MNKHKQNERIDIKIIEGWVNPGERVLDLGCGDGALLEYLVGKRKIRALGIEKDFALLTEAVRKGIPAVRQDINLGLKNIESGAFDTAIISQTLQELNHPDELIRDILRIARYGIVSFPNFGNIKLRLKYLFGGKMPKSGTLPYEWFETPNIHLLSFADFRDFCEREGISILKHYFLFKNRAFRSPPFPNALSESCVALISWKNNIQE